MLQSCQISRTQQKHESYLGQCCLLPLHKEFGHLEGLDIEQCPVRQLVSSWKCFSCAAHGLTKATHKHLLLDVFCRSKQPSLLFWTRSQGFVSYHHQSCDALTQTQTCFWAGLDSALIVSRRTLHVKSEIVGEQWANKCMVHGVGSN